MASDPSRQQRQPQQRPPRPHRSLVQGALMPWSAQSLPVCQWETQLSLPQTTSPGGLSSAHPPGAGDLFLLVRCLQAAADPRSGLCECEGEPEPRRVPLTSHCWK
ncbi:hypothetical protein FKM82_025321 [Ascaphus truei]